MRKLRHVLGSARDVRRATAGLEALEARRLFVSVGPDAFGYTAFDHPPDAVDLVAGAAGVVTLLDGQDDAAAAIPLGVNTFRFYGVNYSGANQLFVSTNGLITLAAAPGLAYENTDLTDTPTQRAIAPLWDDWQTNVGAGSAVLYRFETSRLVIEWNDVPNYDAASAAPATFQAILQLNPPAGAQSEIIFNYPDLDVGNAAINDGGRATVGVKDFGTQGANRLLVSQNDNTGPFVGTGRAVRVVRDPSLGSIGGDVFGDANNNGTKDAGETGLAEWTVYLDADGDAALDAGERSTVTDASGNYVFGGVVAGTHRVRQVVQSGYAATAPAGGVHTLDLAAGQNATGLRFGARALPAEIRGMKWHDLNGNRARDAGEPGLSGWTIYLDTDRDNALDAGEPSAVTSATGAYAFTNLRAGTYVVAEVQQPGWVQTFPGVAGAGAAQAPAGAALNAGEVAPAFDARGDAATAAPSDAVRAAVARASDLSRYTPAELASATDWVVGVKPGRAARDVVAGVGSRASSAAPGLADAFVMKFDKAAARAGLAGKFKARDDVAYFYPLVARQQSKRAFTSNDPLFPGQWHLKNTGQTGGTPGADANVQPAWNADFTGNANTVIGVVDDGLEYTHPDLSANYQAANSYDFNFNDADPAPGSSDAHGTAVAGVAAGRGGNGTGVTGAAPLAGLAGLRLIAAATTDAQEANALGYQKQSIDVYSNSWGPFDDAARLEAPGPLTLAAFANGVATGRGGLGSIYTWAAGNGLGNNDNANYDGYANSRYVIAVSAIDHNGDQSFYSEPGAPILVAAYSDGSSSGITTTDLTGSAGYNGLADTNYTNGFGGTSSATPLVSGVVAQMLHANPNLTWRDVQHVLVQSARKNDPADAGWRLNGAGHDVSHKYGFGAIDAGAAVALARTWQTAGPEIGVTGGTVQVNTAVADGNATGVTSSTTINDAIFVEGVEVVFSASHADRGDLRVVLTSPSGTQSVLAETHGDQGDDYSSWVFSSKQHWDEVARGAWTLNVTDADGNSVGGTFNNWKLNVYGTQADATVHYVTVGNGEVRDDVNFGNRDAAAPTADVIDVAPDPRTTAVDTVTFKFNESVTGFGVSDLSLTRNGGSNLLPTLPSSPSLTSADGGITWTLGGIGGLTGAAGSYALTLTAAGSGIVDSAGNALAADAADAWVVNAPSDATPPTVTNVFAAGSAWAANFLGTMQTSGAGESGFGYRLDAAAHADELPWINVNRFSVRFSENVNVSADDLVVRGINNATYANGTFAYDAASFTASWTLTLTAELRDKLLLDLDADAGTGVTDAAGNRLDGEWTNPATSPTTPGGADTFPSGNGAAGGDFQFRVNVLPGDANRSGGSVVGSDVTLVRNAQNSTPGAAGSLYTIFKDVNGTNSILGSDVTAVRNRQGSSLPAGEPAAPAATTSTVRTPAPTAATASPTKATLTAGLAGLAPAKQRLVDELL